MRCSPFEWFKSKGVGGGGGGGSGGVIWVDFCWVCAFGLSKSLSHYSLFCGHIIDPILVTFGTKQFLQFQLSHFLFTPKILKMYDPNPSNSYKNATP